MISIRMKFILAAAALAIVVHCHPCAAAIAFNNFGPNETYGSPGGNWQGRYHDQEVKLAQRFTPSISGQLHWIGMGLTYTDGLNDQSGDVVTLAIVPDVDGKPGASELWSQIYIDKVTNRGFLQGATGFQASGGPSLQAGTSYWLTSTTPSTAGLHLWWRSPMINEPPAIYFIDGGGVHPEGEWDVLDSPNQLGLLDPGFALRIVVIPEPAAAALMLAASAAFLAVRRRTSL